MGLVSGFMKSAGDAAEYAGKAYLMDSIQKDRDEVNALRDANLKSKDRDDAEEFTTSEREAKQEFESEEAEKDRAAKTKQSKIAADARGYRGRDPYKYSFSLGGQPMKASDVLAQYKEENDLAEDALIDGESPGFLEWAKEQGYKINTGEKGGTAIKTPEKPAEAGEPSTADMEQARKEYNKKSSWLKSDKSQFGMTETDYVNKRAREIMAERQGGKKGIVGSETAAVKPAAKPAKAESYGVPKGHVSYIKQNKNDANVVRQFRAKYPNLTDEQFNALIGK